MHKTIALLTDFGVQDVYVGVMKGVMRNICPDGDFIDITHAIAPQNIQMGAFALLDSYQYFPKGTVFLVVVDPTVGSNRQMVAVKAGDYGFIAPDNGVLSYVLTEIGDYEAAIIENQKLRLQNTSSTFHGRDIFSPAAAHLANGVALDAFGQSITELVQLLLPRMTFLDNKFIGEVIRIDHFGNIITSIGRLSHMGDGQMELRPLFHDVAPISFTSEEAFIIINGINLTTIRHAYHEVSVGDLLIQVDSMGQLEIAVNQGNAAAQIGVSVGDEVTLCRKS